MTLVLDAGALIGLDRGDRALWSRLKATLVAREPAVTHAGIVGQVWRGGARQDRLARVLAGLDVRPIDEQLGRRAGALLGATGERDVIDAALACLAADGDEIVTGDAEDLERLVRALGVHAEIVRA